MILIFILYALFGATFTLAKGVVSYFSPVFFIGIRMIASGILLLLYYRISCYVRPSEHSSRSIKRSHWKLFAQVIIFHVYMAYVCEFLALPYVASSKVALIFNIIPFITAFLSYLILLERITVNKTIGLIVGFLGLIPALGSYIPEELNFSNGFVISISEILLLVAVCSAAYGWIIVKKLLDLNYSSVFINGVAMLGGGIMALMHSLVIGEPCFLQPLTTHNVMIMAGYLCSLILIGNVICYNLYGRLLKQYSPVLLALAGGTTPLYAAVYGFLFFKEEISWYFPLSVACVILGLWIFYSDDMQHSSID